MEFEWDPGKRAENLLKHGVDFNYARIAFERVVFSYEDIRKDYGEPRFTTIGMLNGRLMVIIHTRRGNNYRIISMRKANERERKRYQKPIKTP
jgi:uncharacterized protein